MNQNLGDSIYKDLSNNEYLNELFDSILCCYSNKLFGFSNKININIKDALRFADLLSKSTNKDYSDLHNIWAQDIVALLSYLYPQDETIKLYTGSILTNIGNYRGLQIQDTAYTPTSILDDIYEKYKKSILRIPTEEDKYFLSPQKIIYDSLNKNQFSYSGPTSIGKSFIMQMFIKNEIINNYKKNYVFIVPTRALINEVSSKIILELKDLLNEKDYKVITSPNALSLNQNHNFILVMTPERFLYLLIQNPLFKVDYIFVDEAHKISIEDARSTFYYKIIGLLSERDVKPNFIFASPYIPNPDVYLDLTLQEKNVDDSLQTSYSPVSQLKFIVDFNSKSISIFNNYSEKFLTVSNDISINNLNDIINTVGKDKKNIIYSNSIKNAINYAISYSNSITNYEHNDELYELSQDIKKEIHNDYYLAKTILKGVAYHVGYLPNSIRLRIEDLFQRGIIKNIFCTSTLIEGVNLSADNLFVCSHKNGPYNMKPIEFKNLIGRVGRIEYNLFGNVFLISLSESNNTKNYKTLVSDNIPEQKLSIVSKLDITTKKFIIDNLIKGNTNIPKVNPKQNDKDYLIMRRFSLILLKDILDNNQSIVKNQFSDILTLQDETSIKLAFKNRLPDDDITISLDQIEKLQNELSSGLAYPMPNFTYDDVLDFLEKLCIIYNWEKYESTTLGYVNSKTHEHTKLKRYSLLLLQWIQGNGTEYMISSAINHKRNNPKNGIKIGRDYVTYNDSIEHKNIVINETLDDIEQIILFKLSNYFLRFSLEYKKYNTALNNDWYEYVEYGTTNNMIIMLQKYGFSIDSARYIYQNRLKYISIDNDEFKILPEILNCTKEYVLKEVKEIKYNIPEIFI